MLLGLFSPSLFAQVNETNKSLPAGPALADAIWVNSPSDRIHVYPNPSHGTFYFSGVRNSTIEVINLLGQKVLTAEADRDKYPVDLSSQARGIYTYRIIGEGTLLQQGKVVVE